MKPKIVLASVALQYDYLLTKHYYKLPSLGIGYIAAVMEKHGYDVTLVDRTLRKGDEAQLASDILAMRPDIVGFYAVSETFNSVSAVLRAVKESSPSVTTMVGGPHVYGLPDHSMSFPWIDFAIRGEAEEVFLQLVEGNFAPSAFSSVPGLVYRDGASVRANPMALVKDLDSLPFPARHLYPPLDRYRPSLLAYKRLPATGIITSRGCAHQCVFCHSGKGHFKLRFHSADYVLEEIRQLYHRFGIRELIFFDDTFLINQERAARICEGIIRDRLDISWSCNARVNNINEELLRLLKRAGCWMVQFGVESGNQEVLKTIKKGITLDEVRRACTLAEKVGLEVKAYYILGHPGETVDTLNDTIRFMTQVPAHYASINFMTPLPGTELWDTAEKYGAFDRERLESINYLSDRPAFVPYGLTEEMLVNKFREAYLRFYLNPGVIMRHLRSIRRTEDIKKLFQASGILFSMLKNKIISGGEKS